VNVRAAIAYAALITLIVVGLYAYATLPASIPTSFGFDGRPAAWGPKLTILLLPAIGVFAFVLISVVQTVKPRANLPFYVSDDRVDAVQAVVYAGTTDLKTVLMCGFLALTIASIANSGGTLSPAFLPVVIAVVGAVILVVAYILVRAWRAASA